MMRGNYYPTIGREHQPVSTHEDDYRARRITDYLNLVNTIVKTQVEKLRKAPFEKGSEIVKYFTMLPEDSTLKKLFLQMMKTSDQPGKEKLETYLRTQIRPGSIDVNVMAKIDRNNYNKSGELLDESADAVAALRVCKK